MLSRFWRRGDVDLESISAYILPHSLTAYAQDRCSLTSRSLRQSVLDLLPLLRILHVLPVIVLGIRSSNHVFGPFSDFKQSSKK